MNLKYTIGYALLALLLGVAIYFLIRPTNFAVQAQLKARQAASDARRAHAERATDALGASAIHGATLGASPR